MSYYHYYFKMNELDHLAQQLCQISDLMDMMVKNLGVNYNHYAVLYSLACADEYQITQKRICEEWYLPKQTVFNICKEYKERGWIVFKDGVHDKREKVLALTPTGQQQALPLFYATQAVSQRTFDAFGVEKTRQLQALLTEFSRVYGDELAKMG